MLLLIYRFKMAVWFLVLVSICLIHQSGANGTYNGVSSREAVVKAAKYLLKMRNSDYGWESFTPRALVALKFAERFVKVSEKEKALMKKRLDVQILLNLKKNGHNRLVDLAFYVNALYATCQDPRNFHGIDLVGLLRSETDIAIKSDFNFPLVLMTLCLAKEAKDDDLNRLILMYDNKRNGRIGFKSLTVMALAACRYKITSTGVQHKVDSRIRSYLQEYDVRDTHIDIYSKALVHQAFYASRYNIRLESDLTNYQLEDGSFGDLLSTYSAIPALLNTSLTDLKCKGSNYEGLPVGHQLSPDLEKEIHYSIMISDNNKDFVTHSMTMKLEGNNTFYDAMRLAELRDPMYRFEYDETKLGKKVYSLGGLPSDAETGTIWSLYRGQSGTVAARSKKNLREQAYGVDKLFPNNGDHFIYWLERRLK